MDETQEAPPTEEAGQPQRGGGLVKKLMVLGVLIIAGGCLYWQFSDAIDLQKLAAQENKLVDAAEQNPAIVLGLAFLIYVTVTALSLPAATIITMGIGLLCHKVFGELAGLLIAVVVVSFASTSGATLAFLMSRYVLRDSIQHKFGDRLEKFNEALQREGAFYLFTLRLIPVVPFFVINLVMGLTPIRVRTFWWVSQLGMLAGTCVYVYAGSTIPSIEQIVDRSQLRAEEIQDWPGFLVQLRPTTHSGADGPAHQIWELLPEDARQVIATSSSRSPLGDEDEAILLRGLNEIMKRRELSLAKPWYDVELKPQEISKLNRRLLERAFPDHILQPQPVLSVKLFLAFTLLGVFPLIIKKIVARVRLVTPESIV
jgi:uncharacterized membrane protein YdjX (TVP38/TMEM64 family)